MPQLNLPKLDLIEGCGLADCGATVSVISAIDPTRRPFETLRCLVVECGSDIVLVEVGLGIFDWLVPQRRLGPSVAARHRSSAPFRLPIRQLLERHGKSADRVKDIIITHAHRDNLGGLNDFPGARLHAARHAIETATTRGRVLTKPMAPSIENWREPLADVQSWYGFSRRRLALEALEVYLVDLPGHAHGHSGILLPVNTGYVFYLGDAVADVADLVTPTPTSRGRLSLDLLATSQPFASLNTRRRLERLAHEPPAPITFIAARGATSRMGVGGPPYPQIGFL